MIAVDNCSFNPSPKGPRTIVDRGFLLRLKAITARLDISLLDLGATFAGKGKLAAAHWKNDAHWNLRGHAWAASAIADYLAANSDFNSFIVHRR